MKTAGQHMKKVPNGADLLALLIDLYADQNGVDIEYIINEGGAEHDADGKAPAYG